MEYEAYTVDNSQRTEANNQGCIHPRVKSTRTLNNLSPIRQHAMINVQNISTFNRCKDRESEWDELINHQPLVFNTKIRNNSSSGSVLACLCHGNSLLSTASAVYAPRVITRLSQSSCGWLSPKHQQKRIGGGTEIKLSSHVLLQYIRRNIGLPATPATHKERLKG